MKSFCFLLLTLQDISNKNEDSMGICITAIERAGLKLNLFLNYEDSEILIDTTPSSPFPCSFLASLILLETAFPGY